MGKSSTILSLMLIMTMATCGAVTTHVASDSLEEVKEAPGNNNQRNNNPGQMNLTTGIANGPGIFGNYHSKCHTDWGYNRCTDILDLGGFFRFDLSLECKAPYIQHAQELENVTRGEYAMIGFTSSSSSYMVWFLIICGEGNFVVTGVGATDLEFAEDVLFAYDTAETIFDVAKGANPGGAILEAFWDAATAEDYRFGDHDGDGVWNVHDRDYEGPMSSADNVFTRWWREAASDWLDEHPAEDEDEDEDDDDDDDDSTSFTDDDGCPDDEPWILC